MLGSGLNLVSAALGFGMTAAFVAFVCARFACCRARGDDSGPPPSLDFSADLDGPLEHPHSGLEPLVIAAIPTMKYNCEAFCSKDDAQCSICLSEYKEKDILRIIPTCHHNFHLACLDLWLQKQTTCPICRVSLNELQAAMSSACSIQQLPTVPENSVNSTPQCLLPVCQDQRGQSNSQERNESVEVVIEIRR
ncbi:putative RING-H2 finger protein ATL62 [Panicum virgatum]|uniref:RING-type domain-containing protein n=1 Tax=Panicum virgatum TaxID=38727 RepID=A0A8T0PZW8_PANVG|nr:putative RING-H2 finger protein ATL62 [Panicum virgatum]KAG2568157.1 hypothetical protein PVAP13_7NG295100 [Panicum virgatum]